jgi:hypothetical protein
MKTHNVMIYHCISCGRVEHSQLEAEPPQCCGHMMAKTCGDTIHEGDLVGETPGGQTETTPVIEDRTKPR